jgi:hypothetical protein
MQSAALTYIAANQPGYTKTAGRAARGRAAEGDRPLHPRSAWLEAGEVEVDLVEDNFVASGAINIAEPKALWRIFAEMRQTL